MSKQVVRLVPLGGVASLLVFLAGCGGTGTVSGKVKVNGDPVQEGTVSFLTEDDKLVQGNIGPDGSYTVEKVPPGTVKIGVYAPASAPPIPKAAREAIKKQNFAHQTGGPNPYDFTEHKGPSVPDQFMDPRKSGLVYAVHGGSQEHDIDISVAEQPRTKKGGRR